MDKAKENKFPKKNGRPDSSRRELIRVGLIMAAGMALAEGLSACGGGEKKEEKFIRLAFNENPLGPCPQAREAMEAARTNPPTLTGLNRYPDFLQGDLLKTIAEFHHLVPENVVPGCGSSEIFNIIASCFLNAGDVFLTAVPTFQLPLEYAGLRGAEIQEIENRNDHGPDLNALASEVNQATRVIFLCNPNNPTGLIIKKADLENFLGSVWQKNPETIVVIDEAYSHYVQDPDFVSGSDYLREGPLVVVRTFSHAYGLAGVRAGYALAPLELADLMGGLRTPSLSEMGFHWKLGANYNRLAWAAAIASLKEGGEHLKQTRELNQKIKTLYGQAFSERGWEYLNSETNFVLAHAGIPGDRIQAYLYQNGIQVQSGNAFHSRYANWIRVSTGTEAEANTFIEVLNKYGPDSPVAEKVPKLYWWGY
ncbi:MAG: aminotransferase class I/II-fold pyridoxal phosphate-dependent enzyme [Proteobacteria bacterium]|nr:aminotransferase class I/II-fold pyridoxal phosphate-dependent enzyme [Pseudomonadota bacterium]